MHITLKKKKQKQNKTKQRSNERTKPIMADILTIQQDILQSTYKLSESNNNNIDHNDMMIIPLKDKTNLSKKSTPLSMNSKFKKSHVDMLKFMKQIDTDAKKKAANDIYKQDNDVVDNKKKLKESSNITSQNCTTIRRQNQIPKNEKKQNNEQNVKKAVVKKRVNGFTKEDEEYINKLSHFFNLPIVRNKLRNMKESNRNIEYGILKFAQMFGIAFTIDKKGCNYYHYHSDFYDLLQELKDEKVVNQNDIDYFIKNSSLAEEYTEKEMQNTNKRNLMNNKNNDDNSNNDDNTNNDSNNDGFYKIGELVRILDSHHDNVNTFKKIQFDCFRRDEKMNFFYTNTEFFVTTIGQLNFLEWYFKNNVDQFVKDHIIIIKYLNKIESQLKKLTKTEQLLQEKEPESESLPESQSMHTSNNTLLTSINHSSTSTFVVNSDTQPIEINEIISDNIIHKKTGLMTSDDYMNGNFKTRKFQKEKKILKESKIVHRLRMETKKKGKKNCLQGYKADVTISF